MHISIMEDDVETDGDACELESFSTCVSFRNGDYNNRFGTECESSDTFDASNTFLPLPEPQVCCYSNSTVVKHSTEGHRQRYEGNTTTEKCTADHYTRYRAMHRYEEETRNLSSLHFRKLFSESVYKIRTFSDVRDDLKNHISDKTVKTYGSMAEGVVMHNSKIDIMYTLKWVVVQYQSLVSSTDLTSCVLQAEICSPGYVCLIVISGWEYELILKSNIEIDGKVYLSSDLFQAYMKEQCPSTCTETGFRFTDDEKTFTFAFALHSEMPPNLMEEFPRPDSKGWPTKETIQKIKCDGLTLVPAGHKDKSSLEWRMSFTTAETTLVRTFSHVQLIVFAILKSYVSTTFPSDVISTSYLVKTTMFWVMEDTKNSLLNHIGTLIMVFLKKFVYFLSTGYLPNYFISNENLLEDRNITDNQSLATCTSKLTFNEICFFMNHLGNMAPDMTNLYAALGDEMILSFLPLIQAAHNNNPMLQIVNKILRNYHSGFIQTLYTFLLSQQCQIEAQKLVLANVDNKTHYRLQRFRLSLLFIGTNTDGLSGWILVASHFLHVGDYKTYLEILDYLECKRKAREDTTTYRYHGKQLPFWQKLKLLYDKPVLRINGSSLIPLMKSSESMDNSLIPLDIILQYLKFLILMNTGYESRCPELLIQAREICSGYGLTDGMAMTTDLVFKTMENILKDNIHRLK